MPAPAAYADDSDFADYLILTIGGHATLLDITAADAIVTEAVADSLLAIEAATITDITSAVDVGRLRRIGEREIWRRVSDYLSDKTNLKLGSTTIDRTDLQAKAERRLAAAIERAQGDDARQRARIRRFDLTGVLRGRDEYERDLGL